MKHRKTVRFWIGFYALPVAIQVIARKNFAILKENPRHPSLRFKKVGKLWSARVGRDYRALAMEDTDGYVWVWIGHHEEYDRLLELTG